MSSILASNSTSDLKPLDLHLDYVRICSDIPYVDPSPIHSCFLVPILVIVF